MRPGVAPAPGGLRLVQDLVNTTLYGWIGQPERDRLSALSTARLSSEVRLDITADGDVQYAPPKGGAAGLSGLVATEMLLARTAGTWNRRVRSSRPYADGLISFDVGGVGVRFRGCRIQGIQVRRR